MMQFLSNNWMLILALLFVIFMMAQGPIAQLMHGVRSIPGVVAVNLINHENAVIVDVCEEREYEAGHLPGAINIPLRTLTQRIGELGRHKSTPVIVACRSGNRSLRGAVALKKGGFDQVYSLAGGLMAWQRDNFPVEK